MLRRSICVGLVVTSLPSVVLAQSLLTALESEIADIVEKAKPSVVTVFAVKESPADREDSGLLGFFGKEQTARNQMMIGTGLIISSDGFILTKESVTREAWQTRVTLTDESTYNASVVRASDSLGVALLKIGATNLEYARIGRSETVAPGSWVTVIGNSLGVPHAVSVGVVSAVQSDGGLQITAQVDPGSNGSPVFGTKAEAIGIVAGRVSVDQQDAPSTSFFSHAALVYSLSELLPFVKSAVEEYYRSSGWIGVTLVADASAAGRLRILEVIEDSPGMKSGLQIGDLITHFGERQLDSLSQLGVMVANTQPGEVVEIGVLRGDRELKIEVQVGHKDPIALRELKVEKKKQAYPPAETLAPASIDQTGISDRAWLNRRIDALEKEVKALRSLYRKQP